MYPIDGQAAGNDEIGRDDFARVAPVHSRAHNLIRRDVGPEDVVAFQVKIDGYRVGQMTDDAREIASIRLNLTNIDAICKENFS